MSEGPSLTFKPSAAERIVEAAGWRTDANRQIVHEDGTPVLATDGEPIDLTEFAGVVQYEGETRPVREDFCSLVDEVKRRRNGAYGGGTRER